MVLVNKNRKMLYPLPSGRGVKYEILKKTRKMQTAIRQMQRPVKNKKITKRNKVCR